MHRGVKFSVITEVSKVSMYSSLAVFSSHMEWSDAVEKSENCNFTLGVAIFETLKHSLTFITAI